MTPTATACAALSAAGRRARRQRVRMLATRYDRCRDLPRLLYEFADRPGQPFAKLAAEWHYLTITDSAAMTLRVMRSAVRHLRIVLAERARRDVEARVDELRVVLFAEAATLRAQTGRRAALALARGDGM